jgi:hypothetical protein
MQATVSDLRRFDDVGHQVMCFGFFNEWRPENGLGSFEIPFSGAQA